MKYIIGLFISTVGFFLASQHLHQEVSAYWDYVAFTVVLLGTFAVMLITFPAAPMGLLVEQFSRKFFGSTNSLKKHVHNCFTVYETKKPFKPSKVIEEKLVNDGMEMLELGFNHEQIQELISQRFEVYSKRINMLAGWFKRGAKYPPAFGLAGTVLGLIHLMRGISDGIDPKETGLRMAVALVATFYGLLLSNLLLNPLGEWLSEELKRDEMKAEASLRTLLLISKQTNAVEAQEVLNSYLADSEKLSLNYAEMFQREEVA